MFALRPRNRDYNTAPSPRHAEKVDVDAIVAEEKRVKGEKEAILAEKSEARSSGTSKMVKRSVSSGPGAKSKDPEFEGTLIEE